MSVHVTESIPSIDVTLGEGGVMELLADDGDGSEACATLRDLVELVLAGGYSERLWYAGDRLVRSKGLLDRGDRQEVIGYRDLLPSVTRRTRQEHRRYEPY
jgi:hypothetical protein